MRNVGPGTAYVVRHPGAFTLRVLRAFRANQGLLLAGAVAYYTLLSMVPLLILILIALSRIVDQGELLATLGRYLEWLIPGQSSAVIRGLADFLTDHVAIGWVLLATMLFFSSLAFSVLESALSTIYKHRRAVPQRHFLVSAGIPYCYMFFLGVGLLLMTVISSALQVMGAESIDVLGRSWSLRGISGLLIYLLGITGEILVLTSIYLVMRVGKPSFQHALIGGVTATVLWEIARHLLLWYFGTLSQVGAVYGSLAASIVLLLSFELGATLLLLGAQVIAEYEDIEISGSTAESASASAVVVAE